jgi:formamidopyrimidine-DNA glycosylase
MPELPEVETIARDLDRLMAGAYITDFQVTNERTRRARPFLEPAENKIRKMIVGKKVLKVFRRAKMLVVDLGKKRLLIHLKMTGQLVFKPKKGETVAGGHPIPAPSRAGVGAGPDLPNRFTRAVVSLSAGDLYFNDVRRFGWMKLLDKTDFHRIVDGLGVEPLTREFTLDRFTEILRKKAKSPIKSALMDQKYLSGIGNIYADEALFRARIKPERPAATLKPQEIRKLRLAISSVLNLSIKHHGTSFSDYRDGRGDPGGFLKYLKVYGRSGKACLVCGRSIRKSRLGGRGTHWCGKCQK